MNEEDLFETWEYPKGIFDWVVPRALSMEGWCKWRKEMEEKYPIRYFFYETLDSHLRHIKFRIRDFKWSILHRIHPKHRYHIIKTSLKPNYYDADTRIIHACFDLLSEFVETNGDKINWEENETHKRVWNEMSELYKWWKVDRKNREDKWYQENERPEIDDELRESSIFNKKHDDNPKVEAYKDWLNQHLKAEAVWEKEDEEMLIRLMKIRTFLWY